MCMLLATMASASFAKHAVSALGLRDRVSLRRHRGPPGPAVDNLSASTGIYKCGPSSKATRLPTPAKASSRMASSIEQAAAEAEDRTDDPGRPQTLCPACRAGRDAVCRGLPSTPITLPQLPLATSSWHLRSSKLLLAFRAPVAGCTALQGKGVHVSRK